MLFGLVHNDLLERRSVESDSGSLSDDHSGKKELVEVGRVDCAESAAVGSGLGSVGLDPSRLDFSPGKDEDCLLEALFELSDQLFVDGGEQDFMAAEREVDKDEGFILAVGDFRGSVDDEEAGDAFAFGIEMIDGIEEGVSDLLFEMVESLL